jgi:hypothetical protein
MNNERDKYADLLIMHIPNPMVIFEIQRKISSGHRFTIGQLANRALVLYLRQWANLYPLEELAKMVNYNPKVLKEKIKQLSGNGHNPDII